MPTNKTTTRLLMDMVRDLRRRSKQRKRGYWQTLWAKIRRKPPIKPLKAIFFVHQSNSRMYMCNLLCSLFPVSEAVSPYLQDFVVSIDGIRIEIRSADSIDERMRGIRIEGRVYFDHRLTDEQYQRVIMFKTKSGKNK